ncbi:MAG: hypothetical protein JO001_01575 [Alphaproteobacteria bacterium]|nr:hypothetical protein [Alphaproteobacteria bacterium]
MTSPIPTRCAPSSPDPFTVESLSPHRYVAADQDDSLLDDFAEPAASHGDRGHQDRGHQDRDNQNLGQMVLAETRAH